MPLSVVAVVQVTDQTFSFHKNSINQMIIVFFSIQRNRISQS